jgi:predicted SnoaL-like aldol condensation-catalyzing enzyme
MSEAGADLVRRLIEEVWVGCSALTAADVTASEFVEHAAAALGGAAPGAVDGPQHSLHVGLWLHEQFPDLEMVIEALITEGDIVAVRTSSTGTNLGRFRDVVPPTGRRFVSSQSHWFQIAGGKLVEHWAVRDDLSTVLQLGILQLPTFVGVVDPSAPSQ